MRDLTPTTDLNPGETVLHSFFPDRATYWRNHAWMAAGAMALGMAALWAMGNPDIWTGAVGGLAAIALRGFYLAADELKTRWDLTNERLRGPHGRDIALGKIATIRSVGSAVQVITDTGDKHLLKYQRDKDNTLSRLKRARQEATE
jgi:hypothetical protein